METSYVLIFVIKCQQNEIKEDDYIWRLMMSDSRI